MLRKQLKIGARALPARILAGAVMLLAGCGADDAAGPNVLLLSVDTMRADRLGAFGYGRPTSPELDALAATSTVFLRAQTQAPWTLPSLASLITGMPSTTHACWTPRTQLDSSFQTMAELLLRAGYDTLAVANQPFLSRQHGLQQGFVHYDDELTLQSPAVTSERVSDKVIQLLEWKAGSSDTRPWLLWAHYFDPHEDYVAHPGLSEDFGTDTDSDAYDGEIRFTDLHLGRVLASLNELQLDETTVVILVTDHGDAFGDHGLTGHGNSLYEELIRSPLIIRVPGLKARQVTANAQTTDILPTVLELAQQAIPSGIAGRSLMPYLRGEQPATAATLSEVDRPGTPLQRSVTLGDWKLIHHYGSGRSELYNLNQDPRELLDVSASEPQTLADLKDELQRLVSAAQAAAADYQTDAGLNLNPGAEMELTNLGYAEALQTDTTVEDK